MLRRARPWLAASARAAMPPPCPAACVCGRGAGSSSPKKTECRRQKCSYPGNCSDSGAKDQRFAVWSVLPGLAIGDGYGKIRGTARCCRQSAPARARRKHHLFLKVSSFMAKPSATRILTGVFAVEKGLEPSCAHIWTPRPWRKPCAGFWPRRASEIAHSKALEIVARQFGLDTWNILSARYRRAATHGFQQRWSAGAPPASGGTGLRLGRRRAETLPDGFGRRQGGARYINLGFLSMKLDWEPPLRPTLPLYMQVRAGGLKLHLSEHRDPPTRPRQGPRQCAGVY